MGYLVAMNIPYLGNTAADRVTYLKGITPEESLWYLRHAWTQATVTLYLKALQTQHNYLFITYKLCVPPLWLSPALYLRGFSSILTASVCTPPTTYPRRNRAPYKLVVERADLKQTGRATTGVKGPWGSQILHSSGYYFVKGLPSQPPCTNWETARKLCSGIEQQNKGIWHTWKRRCGTQLQ